MSEALISIENLSVDVLQPVGSISIIRDLSLRISSNEIYGLAGESGCGKSTLAKSIMRILTPPTVIRRGSIHFGGQDLLTLNYQQFRPILWQEIAMVFQSAMSSLNPVITIGAQMVETVRAHRPIDAKSALERAAEMLEMVGLQREHLQAYPHQLSGGMKQRVMIATALILEPRLLILDEPTTALDVMVQEHILQTLRRLQEQQEFAILFISHDLPLLLDFCDRVGIMYAGRLVEDADSQHLLEHAAHPYTVGLMHSFPSLGRIAEDLHGIAGSPPHPSSPIKGCAFHPRCERSHLQCQTTSPPLAAWQPGHALSCHDPILPKRFSYPSPSAGDLFF